MFGYKCEDCGADFDDIEKAEACEASHGGGILGN